MTENEARDRILSVHEPTAPSRGAVLVLQEGFGVNHHIEALCARLAAQGYLAVAPHLFHRSGDPTFGYDDISLVMPHMEQLTADGVLADIDAALDRIEEAGVARSSLAVVGFCMGGSLALIVAARREVGRRSPSTEVG